MSWQFSTPAVIARETTARLVGPLVSALVGGPRVVGRERLDDLDGPFVICPNHSSHLDVSTLRLALGRRHRRRLAAAAAEDYFFTGHRSRAFLAAWLGGFAFRRRGANPGSVAEIDRLLDAGWSVLLFPEGTRSRDGAIAPFKPGIGLIATRTGRPVVPVRIDGLHDVLAPGRRLPHRGRVEVRFGEALRAQPGEGPREFTARLEAVVRAL
ncbi:MAG TPA: lysophospholipid acyltransferase family protein [Candidatus Limnocylindrales bacterium]|nr:lysophospholipid acyltransferase family protein [Candidatus Limnocylindrales bacterium]